MNIDNSSLTDQMKKHDNAIEDYKNKLNELQLLKDNNDNNKSGKIEILKKELDESYKIINNNNDEFKNKLMATNLIYMFNNGNRLNKHISINKIDNYAWRDSYKGDDDNDDNNDNDNDDNIPSKILPLVRNNLLGASKLTNTLNKLGMDNNRLDVSYKQIGYDKIVKHDLYRKITRANEQHLNDEKTINENKKIYLDDKVEMIKEKENMIKEKGDINDKLLTELDDFINKNNDFKTFIEKTEKIIDDYKDKNILSEKEIESLNNEIDKLKQNNKNITSERITDNDQIKKLKDEKDNLQKKLKDIINYLKWLIYD